MKMEFLAYGDQKTNHFIMVQKLDHYLVDFIAQGKNSGKKGIELKVL